MLELLQLAVAWYFCSQTGMLSYVCNTFCGGNCTKKYLRQNIDLRDDDAIRDKALEASRHKLLANIEKY